MEKSREKIDDSVRDYVSEKRRSLGKHPEIEELTAYRQGDLGASAVEEIRDHLTLCEECSDLLLDLASFTELEPPSEDYRLSPQDVADQKAELLARVSAEEASGGKVLTFTPRPESVVTTREVRVIPGWYHGVAAALLAAAVGLGFWVAMLKGAPKPSSSGINLAQVNLAPSGLRGGPAEEVASLDEDLFMLLDLYDKTPSENYRVEIYADKVEKSLWSREGFKLHEGAYLTMLFPREIPLAQRYKIQVYGLRGAAPELLAEYFLRIQGDKPDETDAR